MVERYNRTLENQLATFVQDHQKDWDLHLPLPLMSYRSAVDETTKLTPAVLMFGRELRVPLDLLLGRPQADIEEQSYLEYAERLRAAIAIIHDFARDQQQAGSQGMKTHTTSAVKLLLSVRAELCGCTTLNARKANLQS